jgi:hypothetical protein
VILDVLREADVLGADYNEDQHTAVESVKGHREQKGKRKIDSLSNMR